MKLPAYSLPDSAPTHQAFGDRIVILIRAEQTGGSHSVVELRPPAHTGPPLHVHHGEDETFYVVEGEFEFQVGGEVVRAGAGAALLAPRDIPHRFENVGDTDGRMVVVLTPGGFEEFFVESGRLFAEGPPSPEQVADLGKRYNLEFL